MLEPIPKPQQGIDFRTYAAVATLEGAKGGLIDYATLENKSRGHRRENRAFSVPKKDQGKDE